jgi:hypothetical protein
MVRIGFIEHCDEVEIAICSWVGHGRKGVTAVGMTQINKKRLG